MPKTLTSLIGLLVAWLAMPAIVQATPPPQQPVRVGIAGLTHTHVHGILGRAKRGDIVIVGIAEPNRALVVASRRPALLRC